MLLVCTCKHVLLPSDPGYSAALRFTQSITVRLSLCKHRSLSSSRAFQESLQARGRVRKDSGNMKVHHHSKLLHELRRVLLDLPRELNDTCSRRNAIISRLSQQRVRGSVIPDKAHGLWSRAEPFRNEKPQRLVASLDVAQKISENVEFDQRQRLSLAIEDGEVEDQVHICLEGLFLDLG